MVRIALVDDDRHVVGQLTRYINEYYNGDQNAYKLSVFSDGMDLITGYRPVYDLIFMDISMEKLDGLRSAKRLRETDEKVIIVFITSLAKYAVRGYEVNALDFMIKPVVYEHFALDMKKAERILKRYSNRNIVINYEGGIRVLNADDIYYVEVYDHWLVYHLEETSYKVRGSMLKLREQIQSDAFQLCSRCYLVNLRYVTALKGNVLTVGRYTLQVSRTRKKDFISALTDYLGGSY